MACSGYNLQNSNNIGQWRVNARSSSISEVVVAYLWQQCLQSLWFSIWSEVCGQPCASLGPGPLVLMNRNLSVTVYNYILTTVHFHLCVNTSCFFTLFHHKNAGKT